MGQGSQQTSLQRSHTHTANNMGSGRAKKCRSKPPGGSSTPVDGCYAKQMVAGVGKAVVGRPGSSCSQRSGGGVCSQPGGAVDLSLRCRQGCGSILAAGDRRTRYIQT